MLTKFKKPILLSLGLLLPMSLTSLSYAETIVTYIGQQPTANIDRPTNGMSKAQVESRYGNPNLRKAAVGKPPISSWVYSDFTVYFEYNTVIHSVVTYKTGQ